MTVYQNSLLDLADALHAGLNPSTAYSLYQDMNSQHLAQVDARRQRIGSLVDLLVNQATSGLPEQQAQILAAAYSGGNVPPKIDNTIDTLYPGPGQPHVNVPGEGPYTLGGQPIPATSPLYQGPTPDQQMQQLQVAQAQQDLLSSQQSYVQQAAQQKAMQEQATYLGKAFASMAQAQVQAGKDPKEVLGLIALSDPFQQLDPAVQAAVMKTVQMALSTNGATTAAAPTDSGGGWSWPGAAGTLAGASVGAGIGSAILPGPGTIVGGLLGSAVGDILGRGAGGSSGPSMEEVQYAKEHPNSPQAQALLAQYGG